MVSRFEVALPSQETPKRSHSVKRFGLAVQIFKLKSLDTVVSFKLPNTLFFCIAS